MALKIVEGVSLSLNKDIDMISKCVPVVVQVKRIRYSIHSIVLYMRGISIHSIVYMRISYEYISICHGLFTHVCVIYVCLFYTYTIYVCSGPSISATRSPQVSHQ